MVSSIADTIKNVQVRGCCTLDGTFTERADRFAVGGKLLVGRFNPLRRETCVDAATMIGVSRPRDLFRRPPITVLNDFSRRKSS
ncbi:hypothetical protein RE6C_05411 [Rhodopirellula europaea 6C]|uniref:Uncharacterized protein n=1 Tax=Rhodopirellula europaea 6C TaxID=1263867 RepID=M2AW34_9BACT|nr:hypothetical protein RE6C_05411 [Rhodopirellula europaea 6C]